MPTEPRTAAERHLARQLDDEEYRSAHDRARRRIDRIDALVRSLDDNHGEGIGPGKP